MELVVVVLTHFLNLSSPFFSTFSLLSNPPKISISLLRFHLLSIYLVWCYFLFTIFLRRMDAKGKNKMVKVVKKESTGVDSDDEGYEQYMEEDESSVSRKKKLVAGAGAGVKKGSSGGGGGSRNCQVEKCTADLSDAKQYHRRHKVCEIHAKAQFVLAAGIRQRFCQQCSRFHELSEFDEAKRSCRRRLAGHNERRRKNATEPQAEGSSRKGMGTQLKDMACGQVDDKGRIKITIQENATYKHFQIR